MLARIVLTDMIDTLCHPSRIILDTLYIRCLESGVARMGENHLTYAKWLGSVWSGGWKTLSISLLGIWNTMHTCAIWRPDYQSVTSTNLG